MAQSISDEELQLKKRARRRLVGAIALVLLAVVFLPMVLDKEPKPVGQDIAIHIPSQENTPFKPQAAAPAVAPKLIPAAPVEPQKAVESQPVAVEAAKQETGKVAVTGEPQSDVSAVKPVAEADAKPAVTPHTEAQQKPATPATTAKPETAAKSQGYLILLGAFANLDNAKQRQAKLNGLGIRFYTEKIKTPSGEKLRVRAGPYATREEAEKVLGRLKTQGIKDGVVAEKNS